MAATTKHHNNTLGLRSYRARRQDDHLHNEIGLSSMGHALGSAVSKHMKRKWRSLLFEVSCDWPLHLPFEAWKIKVYGVQWLEQNHLVCNTQSWSQTYGWLFNRHSRFYMTGAANPLSGDALTQLCATCLLGLTSSLLPIVICLVLDLSHALQPQRSWEWTLYPKTFNPRNSYIPHTWRNFLFCTSQWRDAPN